MTDEPYKLWDYTADYEAHNVAYPWAVYAPDLPDLPGVVCWCVSRERAQIVCDALNRVAHEDERTDARKGSDDCV